MNNNTGEPSLDTSGRDIEILDAFEFADYFLQDFLGYYLYVNASVQSAFFEDKVLNLPKGVMPLTHEWLVRYSPPAVVRKMDEEFSFYHNRSSLIVLVGIFEVALLSFFNRLEKQGKIPSKNGEKHKKKNYKNLLSWAFDFADSNKEILYDGARNVGSKPMIDRLPKVCLDVDDARRLRNLFVHNRGLFKKSYEDDAIKINGRINLHYLYSNYQKNPKKHVAVLLTPEEYISFSQSHIELLHDLHDLIQRKYFSLTGAGYYYPSELPRLKPKRDEWDWTFSGRDPKQ